MPTQAQPAPTQISEGPSLLNCPPIRSSANFRGTQKSNPFSQSPLRLNQPQGWPPFCSQISLIKEKFYKKDEPFDWEIAQVLSRRKKCLRSMDSDCHTDGQLIGRFCLGFGKQVNEKFGTSTWGIIFSIDWKSAPRNAKKFGFRVDLEKLKC